MRELPAESGIGLANWNWKAVCQYVSERFGISLSRSTCLNYPRLHEGRLCTTWDLPSSVPRSGWSRLMRPNGRPSWRSTPSCGTRRTGPEPRYSLLTRLTSVRTRSCGASGCCVESRPPVFTGAGFGGLEQPALRREGQLLFGGLFGDGRGRMDGTGGKQQLRNLGGNSSDLGGSEQLTAGGERI